MSDVIKSYLAKIDREFKTGRATEHTHRPALKDLIESLDSGVSATNEPKRVECGAPDFILRRDGLSIGYVETKDLGKSLDEAEDSDQLQRYKKSLPNLILTDYLEFRWFVDGHLRDSARLGRIGKGDKIQPDKKGIDETTQLLKLFLESRPHQQDATSRAFPRRSGSFMWAATRSARSGSRTAGASSSPSTISCTIRRSSWPWPRRRG
jgi:hypothetical protein